MSDEAGKVKVVIEGDASGAVAAGQQAKEAIKDLGASAGGEAAQGMKDLGAETEKTSEKFITNRREVRAAFNTLSEAFGMGRLGGLVAGGFFAAIAAMAASVNFLKWSWNELKNTISGPIDIGLPPDAHRRITAVAEAWNDYATARAKILAEQNTPQTAAGEQEKQLANELKLIREVLAAEKEKALADLELKKGSVTPEVYRAARANIENIFGEAGTKAEEQNRAKQQRIMQAEAENLELDAHNKMGQALGIKLAPANVVAANEKFLSEQSGMAEKALKEINERIEFIKRVSNPDAVADYAGPLGRGQKRLDAARFHFRYGDWATARDALDIEEPRKAQAQALIDTAETYKNREEAARKQRDELTGAAGKENAEAQGINKQISVEKGFDDKQAAADQYIAGLHQQSAAQIAGASGQTTRAVQHLTDTTLSGFGSIVSVLAEHDKRMDQLARQIVSLGRTQ